MMIEQRLIDSNGSYTLNECNETGHSLSFGGGFVDVYDQSGKHICQFWAGDAPTVDAVEVVRCRSCRHWRHKGSGLGDCTNEQWKDNGATVTIEADDFCSYGERRCEDD